LQNETSCGASRLAYVEVLENEQAITATGFFERALR
jgi:hypothetical protein